MAPAYLILPHRDFALVQPSLCRFYSYGTERLPCRPLDITKTRSTAAMETMDTLAMLSFRLFYSMDSSHIQQSRLYS